MKIQKGIVKYKDRNDIVCTYGITDDGKQYYFLGDTNDKKFSNGNRVASTLLVEAIDPMVKASNIGVIDEDGKIIVPFENKSIRLVNDSVIVVEKAEPVSQSVKDAIEMRNDPLSATKLVSTPAAVKDKLYAQMGNDSRFVFNDQFSEATICDINGNNLVNNEYYSFIAVANNKLYFSKNTVDSPITEYSLLPPDVQSDVTPTNDGKDIDVSKVKVESDVVENAMTATNKDDKDTPPADDLKAAKELGGLVPDIPTVPVIPDVPEVEIPDTTNDVKNDISLPQVEEDPVDVQGLDNVAPIAPPVEEDEVVMEYDDSLSKIVDETATKEEAATEAPTTNSDEEDEVVMEYDDSLSKIEDETVPKEEAATEVPTTDSDEEDEVVMEYDDSLSKIEDETVPKDEVITEAPTTDSVEEDETIKKDEIEPDDIVGSTLEDVPPVSGLPAREEDKVDDKVEEQVPVTEETVVEVEENVEASTENEELDKDISSVVDEISGDVKHDFDINSLLNSNDDDELFTKTIRPDKIDTSMDDFDSYAGEFKSTNNDTIMTDIAKSMTELMNKNREQRALLASYQEKLDVLNEQKRLFAEKYKDQAQKLEVVASKYRNLETTASRLETRNQLLESKIAEKDKLISAQEKELGTLRPQLQGKENLVQLLADAKALLGEEDSYI